MTVMTALSDIKPDSGDHPTMTRILDAAERVFTEFGYAGAGMKAIAQRAEVAQGLLHYHFGNKETLFESVIARRAGEICAAREAALAKVDLAEADALAGIFDAFLRPVFEEGERARAYTIISGKYVGDRGQEQLINKYYDETARKFIDAIIEAEPDADADIAAWAYFITFSAMLMVINQHDRRDRLARLPKREGERNMEDMVRPMVLNAIGGLRMMIAQKKG